MTYQRQLARSGFPLLGFRLQAADANPRSAARTRSSRPGLRYGHKPAFVRRVAAPYPASHGCLLLPVSPGRNVAVTCHSSECHHHLLRLRVSPSPPTAQRGAAAGAAPSAWHTRHRSWLVLRYHHNKHYQLTNPGLIISSNLLTVVFMLIFFCIALF